MRDMWLQHDRRQSKLLYMLSFNFILGLSFIFFCFKLIIVSLSYISIPRKKIYTKNELEPQHLPFIQALCLKPLKSGCDLVTVLVIRFRQSGRWPAVQHKRGKGRKSKGATVYFRGMVSCLKMFTFGPYHFIYTPSAPCVNDLLWNFPGSKKNAHFPQSTQKKCADKHLSPRKCPWRVL